MVSSFDMVGMSEEHLHWRAYLQRGLAPATSAGEACSLRIPKLFSHLFWHMAAGEMLKPLPVVRAKLTLPHDSPKDFDVSITEASHRHTLGTQGEHGRLVANVWRATF